MCAICFEILKKSTVNPQKNVFCGFIALFAHIFGSNTTNTTYALQKYVRFQARIRLDLVNLIARGSLGSKNQWPGLSSSWKKQARPSPIEGFRA